MERIVAKQKQSNMGSSLDKAIAVFIKEKKDYYNQWVYNQPIVIGKKHHENLQLLQKIMHKLIKQFVLHYSTYQSLMPVSKKAQKIIQIFNKQPYQVGTYRTDFVYDANNQVKIIEITCRFALNTLFESSIYNNIGLSKQKEYFSDFSIINAYQNLPEYIVSQYKDKQAIYILKGKDVKNASVHFHKIFKDAGNKVVEIHYSQIKSHLNKMQHSWVVSELTLEEIESLPDEIIEALSKVKVINDFRTVLLIHDKRFFSVLGNEKLQKACLDIEEIEFFKKFYIPTYTTQEMPAYWSAAKKQKDNWILKHRSLGKSKSIYAGIVTAEKDWLALFKSEEINNYVLQQWIPQKTMVAHIGNKEYQDFVTGTLLFFNDNYFGLGPFRTSSHPVTNVVDDRKATSFVLAEEVANANTLFPIYINS